MNPEPILVTCALSYLHGQGSLDEVLDCAEQTRQSIEQHRQEMLQRLHQEPPTVLTLVQGERRAWEESCNDFLQWSKLASSSAGQSDRLEALCEGLPVTAMRLQLDMHRLEQALWVSRGPSTFAPLNRILAGLFQGADLLPLCQQEGEVLSLGAQAILESYPEPLRNQLAACLEALMAWLDSLPDSDEHLDPWGLEGEALGKDFARYDLHYLVRGYAGGPTIYPTLNLALNASWLQEQELVSGVLTEYCLEQAVQQLSALQPPEIGELPEVQGDLQQLLQQMLKQCQRGQDLKALREAATEVALELQLTLEEVPAEENQSQCPLCGQAQPLGSSRCSACGSRMLGQSQSSQPEDRLESLLGHALELLCDQEFAPLVRQGLDLYQADMHKAQAFKEANYSKILAEFQAGLQDLEEFLEQPDRQLFDTAAQRLRQAEARLREWRDQAADPKSSGI